MTGPAASPASGPAEEDVRAFLAGIPLLEGLSDPDLDDLVEGAVAVDVPTGTVLLTEGEQSAALYVVWDGAFDVTKRSGGQEAHLATCARGALLGEISLLEGGRPTATVRARTDATVLRIGEQAVAALLERPPALREFLRSVAARLRNTQAMLQESEKLAALGTLSAGLSHELNNPAAAAQRAGERLGPLLARWAAVAAEAAAGASAQTRAALVAIVERNERAAAAPPRLDALARGDAEEELGEWLRRHEVDGAWELAGPLAALGWDAVALDEASAAAPAGLVGAWAGLSAAAAQALADVQGAAGRISEIVSGVKDYTHRDRASLDKVDVVRGLEGTLALFRHRLREVEVVRDYADDLPAVEGYPAELNQVWTNLVANALDAMDDRGRLEVRARRAGDGVLVEVADDGPGMPDDVRERALEPFFTTKPVGKGTGLGLHIVHNVVVGRHSGEVRIDPRDGGGTRVTVRLP